MRDRRFCHDTISILRQHEDDEVVEVKRVDITRITSFESRMLIAVGDMLEDLYTYSFLGRMAQIVSLCQDLLEHMGFEGGRIETSRIQAASTFIRKTALLLDIAVVSYVRSHGSDFDASHFGSEIDSFEVCEGEDPFAFTCSWRRLACLDAFLDKRKVLVFYFFRKNPDNPRSRRDAKIDAHILTRMQDLADIWGPVYTVPSPTGFIKFYGVSKGAICRVKDNGKSKIPWAVRCHFFSRSSFFVRKASRLLSGENLLLDKDDWLLIGNGLHENQYCKYTISDFSNDNASDIIALGTSDSVWRIESRSAAVGFAKYIGVTVSGTQKLIPQTTLKQHILDKWNSNPSRSNPGVLNQLLGVEISHCTGNARRVSLRKLMTSTCIWPILERQSPGWTNTRWGRYLSSALRADEREAIFHVWRDFVSNRTDIAELFCCIIDLLDRTGRDGSNDLKAALLYDDEDFAVSIKNDANDWSIALEDTHLSSAYVVINEQCMDCEVPDHSTSTCTISRGYTVLESRYASEKSDDLHDNIIYKFKPSGQLLKQVDCGGGHTLVVEPTGRLSTLVERALQEPRSFVELYNRTDCSTGNMVYIRASNTSYHGRQTPRKITDPIEDRLVQGMPRSNAEASSSTSKQANIPASESSMRQSSKKPGQSKRSRPSGLQRFFRPWVTPSRKVTAPAPKITDEVSATADHVSNPKHQNKHRRPKGKKSQARSSVMHTAAQSSSHRNSTSEDDDPASSDVYGQDIHTHPMDANGILNDLANYTLEEDDAVVDDSQNTEQENGHLVGPRENCHLRRQIDT